MKVAKRVNLKSSLEKILWLFVVMNANLDLFQADIVIYAYIESLYFTPKTNIVLYINR